MQLLHVYDYTCIYIHVHKKKKKKLSLLLFKAMQANFTLSVHQYPCMGASVFNTWESAS